MKLKLQQGQMWRKGDQLLRIVHLERLSVGYKDIKNIETKEGEHKTVTKKEFCRLIKGAELLPEERKDQDSTLNRSRKDQ